MEYVLHLVVFVSLYGVLTLSLDLIVGHLGVVSLAHASLFGVGSYASALAALSMDSPVAIGVGAAALFAGLWSLPFALASRWLREDSLAVFTLALQMVFYAVAMNWVDVTRGPLGLPGIPTFEWGHAGMESMAAWGAAAVALLAATWLLKRQLLGGRYGRSIHAVREDDAFAQSLGINAWRIRIVVFAVSGVLAGIAGAFFAHYVTFIEPNGFGIMESFLLVSMVVIGGPGTRWGPVAGAALLILLPEWLRFVGLPSAVAASSRQIIFGFLLVGIVMLRPSGAASIGRRGNAP